MPRPNWKNVIILNTAVTLIEGNFENFHLFLKIPPSDLRQKTEFIGASHPCKIIPERWSKLVKFDTSHSDFKESLNLNFNVVMNIDVPRRKPYRLSRGITLDELDTIWSELSHVKDYIQADDLVESTASEIIDQTRELVQESAEFWSAVKIIARWVNSHIVYTHILQGQPYQGALGTLNSRRAICSDFVHLFLAMTRSIDIPSRAIIGLAKQQQSEPWQVHSWAEVYDPKFGWTPLDITVQPIKVADLKTDYVRFTAGYNCAGRFYAFYTTPQETSSAELQIEQYVFIDDDVVQIKVFDE